MKRQKKSIKNSTSFKTCFCNIYPPRMASMYTNFAIFFTLIIPTVLAFPELLAPEPAEATQTVLELEDLVELDIKEFKPYKNALDPLLVSAEKNKFEVIKVKKDGTGNFKTITEAINSIPEGNKRRVIVYIGGGEYYEKITVKSTKPFLTFYGQPGNMPRIVYNATALHYGTVYSATVAVESNYFVAANIEFVNSAPKPDGSRQGEQAVAMRISGDKAAFFNCKFIGYQDTLCDDRGRHFFKDCFIQGSVDFIFGNGKSLYLNTRINSVADNVGVITAQGRQTLAEDSGFAFVYCNITGTGRTYLGRAWKERSRVVFAYTYMGSLIMSEGWDNAMHVDREKTVYYGEYRCLGPGASPLGRVKYAKILTNNEAKPFLGMNHIQAGKWLLPVPKL